MNGSMKGWRDERIDGRINVCVTCDDIHEITFGGKSRQSSASLCVGKGTYGRLGEECVVEGDEWNLGKLSCSKS